MSGFGQVDLRGLLFVFQEPTDPVRDRADRKKIGAAVAAADRSVELRAPPFAANPNGVQALAHRFDPSDRFV
jgi:hypothetical protein